MTPYSSSKVMAYLIPPPTNLLIDIEAGYVMQLRGSNPPLPLQKTSDKKQ